MTRGSGTGQQGSPPSPSKPPGMPRWVRWGIAVALTVVVVVAVAMAIAGGEHGPGRHGVDSGVWTVWLTASAVL